MAESQGNPPPNGGQGTDTPEGSDQPKYVTQEQLNEVVNRAITGRLTDFEKRQKNSLTQILADRDTKLAGSLTEALSERFGEALDEKLAALKPKEEEQQKGNEAQPPPPPPKVEDSPAFKALQKKLETFERAAAEEAQKRQAAEAKTRDINLRTTVVAELEKHGITGDRARLARGHLIDAERLVTYRPESDEIVFKSGDDELPLADGLKSWVGTDQGKFFLPPKGTQGSGDKPGGGSNGGGGADPNNPLAQLGNTLIAHLRRGG